MKAGLLRQVGFWQKSIAVHLVQQNSGALASEVDTAARQVVLAVLWLILCEQRGVAVSVAVKQSFQMEQGDRLDQQLLAWLNRIGSYLGQPLPFTLPEHLSASSELLHNFITELYRASRSIKLPSHFLGQVYEQGWGWSIAHNAEGQAGPVASVANKKSGGIYYTPEAIVNYVIEQTIEIIIQNLFPLPTPHSPLPTPPLVLDPACGGGAFLLAAYQRLLDWHLQCYRAAGSDHPGLRRGKDSQWCLTQAERSRILQAHIFGVDVDPEAVAVTQLSLWLKLLEDLPESWQCPLPNLNRNILCGDAVMGLEGGFEWEQAFPQVVQQGGFDAVIGNPPYVDSEWMSLHLPQCRQYCGQRYRSATGNWDLFCVFIEKAIDLCRAGGVVSLVVPNKLASADYARVARQMLAQENQLLTIRNYAQVPVFAASVYPIVFVAQKQEPTGMPVQYEVMQDLQQVQHIRSLSLDSSPSGWHLTTNSQQSSLLARLQQEFPTLGQIAQVRGAATVAEAYRIQALIQDTSALTAGDLQVVNSGTIDRYRLLWGEKPLRYLGQFYQSPVIPAALAVDLPAKRYQQAQQPKIIVAGMTQRLECALDAAGSILAGKSTSIIWVEDGAIDLCFLLGLLNSQLLSFYFSHAFSGNQLQGGYFRVGPPQLRSLPIALPDLNSAAERRIYAQLVKWVEQRLADPLQSENQLDRAIDRLVCQLYRLTDEEQSELT